MSFFNKSFLCPFCRRNIPICEKIIHNTYCRPQQNIISLNVIFHDANPIRNSIINNNNNIKNINTIKTFLCNYCNSEININEKEDHLYCHNLYENEINNNRNINNNISNESMLGEEDIINTRNIQSNYQRQVIPTDFNYNITNYNYNSFDYNNNKNIIENLKVNKIKDISKFKEEKCIICLENFQINDSYILLQCIHFFHDDCIKKWILIKNRCPICNYEIDINNDN